MKWHHVLVCGLFGLVVAGCGSKQNATLSNKDITEYQGAFLPTPDDAVWRRVYPPAWVIVGDQAAAGMYLSGGSGERIPDLSQLPQVTLPQGVDLVVVFGTEAVHEWGATTRNLADASARDQPLSITRNPKQADTHTLSMPIGSSHQFLIVTANVRNSEGVFESISYGWEIIPLDAR